MGAVIEDLVAEPEDEKPNFSADKIGTQNDKMIEQLHKGN